MANASYTSSQLRDYAWMSQAAYLKLDDDAPASGDGLKSGLLADDGFNPANLFATGQATLFTDSKDGYKLLSQQPDQSSGLSATLFQSAKDGAYTIAVRGTDPENQFWEDLVNADALGVVAQGTANDQLFDAYRYYKQLTATGSVVYSGKELTAMASMLVKSKDSNLSLHALAWGPVAGVIASWALGMTFESRVQSMAAVPKQEFSTDEALGLIPPSAAVNFTGHSLGGHVAALLAEMVASFHGSGAVGDIVTYNAPATNALTYEVQNWLGKDTTVQSGILGERHLAVIGEAGVEVTAGLGRVNGTKDWIFIEEETGTPNHSIVTVTDALAIYKLYADLSPALTQGAIKGILEASSNTALNSLETALDALRALLIDGGIATDSGKQTPSEKRDAFYKNLYELQKNGNYTALQTAISTGSAAIVASGGSTGDQAKTDFGRFLALDYLLPITLTGADNLLTSTHQTIHDAWKADQDLTPEQKANGEATYSDRWYTERTRMLGYWLDYASSDGRRGVDATLPANRYYQDLGKGVSFTVDRTSNTSPDNTVKPMYVFGTDDNDTIWGKSDHDVLFGGGGMDRIDGDGGDDYIEGNGGADIVTGGEGKDQLLGGAGTDQLDGGEDDDNLNGGKDNDTLKGGKGSDRLYGGAGSDTYEFSTGDGTDTIVDWDGDKYGGDGQGSISFDGQGLSGSYDVKVGSANQWGNATYTFAFTGIPGQRGLLTISKVGGTDQILIPDFKNGDAMSAAKVSRGGTAMNSEWRMAA